MDAIGVKHIRIGDILREKGYVDAEQIEAAANYQRSHRGTRLGDAFVQLGFLTETQLLDAMAENLELSHVSIETLPVSFDAVRRITYAMARKFCALPVEISAGELVVAVNDPTNYFGLDNVRQAAGMRLRLILAEKEPLERMIEYYYSEIDAQQAAERANAQTDGIGFEQAVEYSDAETPIINLLDRLILRAYNTGSSDIHIEPFEHHTAVRMRTDGTIVEYVRLQSRLHPALIARIKILSDLDIAERRLPQDGHFRVTPEGNVINIRVSILPTVYGEKAVLRLLASNTVIEHADQFGMDEAAYDAFRRLLDRPNGIIYLTGPTGSGKSTTLYMVLEELRKRSVNISTIEDPVEKNIEGINQTQVNTAAGLTFESGLRAILRQDPDIIMVGETRDTETARISVRAALTGHLVFSTLHTNDTPSTVIRLADMGVEPYLIANSVTGAVAQRLMRKVCPYCSEQAEPTELEREFLRSDVRTLRRAKGCHMCGWTGYRGRIAVHEILTVDKTIRRMIAAGAEVEDIRSYAVDRQGMKTLRESAAELVIRGVTTMEELNRIAFEE